MSNPRNKTKLRVGDKVWSRTCNEYEVTKIDVLSNEILYLTLHRCDDRYDNHAVAVNSAITDRARVVAAAVETDYMYYFNQKEAEQWSRYYLREIQRQELGRKVKDIIDLINKSI